MNRIILVGRLTQEPELKYTPNGTAVARFTMAVTRRFKRDEADFITITVFGNHGENCAKYLVKGQNVAVDGRLQISSFEGKDGQRRWWTEVIADDVQFLDKPSGAGSGSGSGETRAPAAARSLPDDEWADFGREVSLEDIDIAAEGGDDEVPF